MSLDEASSVLAGVAMALGSEAASDKVTENWEVGSTEDVVQAFIEKLVDPLLPLRVSLNGPPSKEAQKSVATQMHAVVLLYNYYHRKQKIDLRFLDFVSFCKLSVVLRPRLISFMKLMKESKSMDLNGAEDQLSATEKAINNACDIAVALDTSRDVPNTELWPISKVAVLLVDQTKENCYLEFGLISEGVWSLIEKSNNESNINMDILIEERTGNKRKSNYQSGSTVGNEFLQLGYNAVKDVTGLSNSDLVVLESHVVYSLSKLKSAAHFCIMQCSQPFSIKNQVSLKFLLESLQGPLAEKSYGSWTTTPVVEFYHMLPYAGYISHWLSRKDSCLPSFNGCNAHIAMNYSKEATKSEILVLRRTNFNDVDFNHKDSNSSRTKADTSPEIGFNSKKIKQISCGNGKGLVDVFQRTAKDGNTGEKDDDIHDILDSSKKPGKFVSLEVLECKNNDLYEGLLSDSSKEVERTNLNDSTTFKESDDRRKNYNSNVRVRYHRRKNTPFTRSGLHDSGGGSNLKDVDENACIQTTETNENVSESNGVLTVFCNQNGTTLNQQGQFDTDTNFSELQNFQDSEDLNNALSLLYRKRHELCAKMRSMENTLAFCEDNIQRIREGGDIGLARQCIKSIINGNYPSLLNREIQIQNKGHDIYLPGKSSCEDLEYICLKNNWRLPRYTVEPTEGKFLSNVVVKSKDFKISLEGDLEFKPSNAQESAAAKIIAKIRDQAAELLNKSVSMESV